MTQNNHDQKIKQYYEQDSNQYDKVRYSDTFGKMLDEKQKNCLLQLLPEDKNVNIVEVGCGTGRFLRFLNGKGYRNLTGVDSSPSMLAHLYDIPQINKKLGDIYHLPYEDNTFDVVFSVHVIMHLENPFFALREMLRISKRYVIFDAPNKYSLSILAPLARMMIRLLHLSHHKLIHPRHFSIREIKKELQPHKIDSVKASFIIPSTGPLPDMYKKNYSAIENIYQKLGHKYASQLFMRIKKSEI